MSQIQSARKGPFLNIIVLMIRLTVFITGQPTLNLNWSSDYDAAQEIRNGHLTRDEGVALVKRYDGEFPQKYFDEFLQYISVSQDEFFDIVDQFRSPHLWEKIDDS